MKTRRKTTKEDILRSVEERFERQLTTEISKVSERITETKSEIIKWMFIFWAGQIGIMHGSVRGIKMLSMV